MRTSEAVRQFIAVKPNGAVFSAADLRLAGTRAAIDQALLRLMRAGILVRVARGLYALAGQSVAAQTVARAVAQKTGERVGLAPNAELNDELLVPTSGLSRTVKAGGHTLQFRPMSQRKVQLASSPKVKRVFKRCEFGQMTRVCVTRMLGNISKGLSAIQTGNAGDRPRLKSYSLKSAPKLEIGEGCFDVLDLDKLLMKKSIAVYSCVRSQDIFDVMVLTRDHGYNLKDIFAAIDAYQPIRHKDPEHFKGVVTGLIPVDANDEGFSSIRLNVKMDAIYTHFKKLVNDYEVKAVQGLRAGFEADQLTRLPPL